MALFEKKKRVIEVGGQKIELEPKPSRVSLFGKKQPKQAAAPASELKKPPSLIQPQTPPVARAEELNKIEADLGRRQQTQVQKPGFFGRAGQQKKREQLLSVDVAKLKTQRLEFPQQTVQSMVESGPGIAPGKLPGKPTPISRYLQRTLAKQKGLATALREQGIQTDPYQFVKRMLVASIALSLVIGITVFVLFSTIGLTVIEAVLFGVVLALAVFQVGFKTFLNYPSQKAKATSKNVERDILFAARDMIISLRSGMPLFNTITSVSKGYGDASKEFAKIVERVQLGMPLEEAIDDTIAATKSQSFRRIMLQASVSIKAGADVVSALQSIIDQLSQERIIELRSYGQKLNAIAMFYMLFGVILPSMGIAVVTILTTFIALFTVNITIFEFVLVGIVALQLVFLRLITSSRPVFTM